MVLLGAADERDLIEWKDHILFDEKYAEFREPDIGDELTAIACLPKDPKIFKSLKLI